ncbi:suppressor-of-stellate-like protein [Drosophila grimshawi]|uniref:suppressor-of-stellate-like protein n=1 Tax=Drosophila grimshawi TaxID=7222 RepID=UPI000C870227|nr:suppressor-of-stellate-like protein [Drosophila grimshawi]
MSLSDGSWIDWFVGQQANEFLCRVPDEYARDRFNLTGLETLVPDYYDTLDAILDSEFDTEYGFEVNNSFIDPENVEQLYGMIHARYILSQRGIADMCVKYKRGDFGVCPRIHCDGQLVLPVGLTDRVGESHVKVYCARCQDIYQPNAQCALDGAMFGRSFPHMFFMQQPKLLPEPPIEKYSPRIYGFKVHKAALLAPSAEPATTSKESCNKTAPNRSPSSHYHFSID